MSELAMTARCSHCQRMFAGPQLVLVGKGVDAVNNRLMQFMEKLTAHVMNEHKEEARGIMLAASEYQGMLILSQFQTSDENLKTQSDVIRWGLHQRTLTARYSDQMIAQWVDQVTPDLMTLVALNDTANLKRNLAGMLQSMRDNLEEPAKYSFRPFEAPSDTKLVS